MKQKVISRVISQKEIAPDIFDLWLETDLAKEARAGQFIGVFPEDKSTLLPRPISICEVREDGRALRIVYRIAGQGTREFSERKAGDELRIMGPLGNGFPVEKGIGKRVFLMGGGIGIPPMVELAKELKKISCCSPEAENEATDRGERTKKDSTVIRPIVGYRDKETFLSEDLGKYGALTIATEDGSVGTKGNVMTAVGERGLEADVIFACGPMPMLRAIKSYALECGIPAYLSLEEHMACGVGACLGCVVKTREVDHHSHVKNARICTDGPVFEARDVEI